jgi:hypothetical protein
MQAFHGRPVVIGISGATGPTGSMAYRLAPKRFGARIGYSGFTGDPGKDFRALRHDVFLFFHCFASGASRAGSALCATALRYKLSEYAEAVQFRFRMWAIAVMNIATAWYSGPKGAEATCVRLNRQAVDTRMPPHLIDVTYDIWLRARRRTNEESRFRKAMAADDVEADPGGSRSA